MEGTPNTFTLVLKVDNRTTQETIQRWCKERLGEVNAVLARTFSNGSEALVLVHTYGSLGPLLANWLGEDLRTVPVGPFPVGSLLWYR